MEDSGSLLPSDAKHIYPAGSGAAHHDAAEEITDKNIRRYTRMESRRVLKHIRDLDREWDIDRALQLNASALIVAGLALGVTVHRKWFALPAVVSGFLLYQGLHGRCLPLPILRRMGFRTRREIDMEKYTLRGHLLPLD